MYEEKFVKKAIDIAADNVLSGKGGPYGAVIIRDGRIISTGANTVTNDNDATAHAEVNAIRNAGKVLNQFDLSACELYSSCEPCPMCLGAIYWAGIKKVYFAADRIDAENAGFIDKHIYDEIGLDPDERSVKCIHVKYPGRNKPFNLWKKSDKRVDY